MRVREAVIGIVLFEIVGFSRALLDSSMSSTALPDILTDDRWWAYPLSRVMAMRVVLVRHMRMRVPKRQVPMSMTVGSNRHCIMTMFVMPVIMSVGVLVVRFVVLMLVAVALDEVHQNAAANARTKYRHQEKPPGIATLNTGLASIWGQSGHDRCRHTGVCESNSTLSASIAVYHPQAELSGGRSDGKFVVRWGKSKHCQTLISA